MFQPIHHSILLSLAILATSGVLTWALANPLILVVGLFVLAQIQSIGRFNDEDDSKGDRDDDHQPIGFLADVS